MPDAGGQANVRSGRLVDVSCPVGFKVEPSFEWPQLGIDEGRLPATMHAVDIGHVRTFREQSGSSRLRLKRPGRSARLRLHAEARRAPYRIRCEIERSCVPNRVRPSSSVEHPSLRR